MKTKRMESDSMGHVEVPADQYWGAQTQRSIEHFQIGVDRFKWQFPMIRALGILKKSAALANLELGQLAAQLAGPIVQAADEVIAGSLNRHFPLVVFQTGSGTQSNMNANEVIANRAIEIMGGVLGSKLPVHPNDHVNCSQSSNDTFPTAMHIAVICELHQSLFPRLRALRDTLADKAQTYALLVKTGRTHLQDAAPITLGQEIGSWVAQIEYAMQSIETMMQGLYDLAIGGTAVGTGLNAPQRFGELCAREIAGLTGYPFRCSANRFFSMAAHDALVNTSGALRTLAGALLKIANDVRWLASGPRCGIGEIHIPENEPGSSIMPGKVNPTQCEALSMVCIQVFGNDAATAFAGSQGNFQLNVYKPVMVHNVLESIALLGDACGTFNRYCAAGIQPDYAVIQRNLDKNLMLVTALSQHIGYDNAARIAKAALQEDKTLRAVALEMQLVSAADFDAWMEPLRMTQPGNR